MLITIGWSFLAGAALASIIAAPARVGTVTKHRPGNLTAGVVVNLIMLAWLWAVRPW